MALTENCYSRKSGTVLRSSTPAGRFHLSSSSSSATGFASYSSSFASRSSTLFSNYQTAPPQQQQQPHQERSASSTRVNFRSLSPGRSISAVGSRSGGQVLRRSKRTCLCSPTNHPGSFRCSLHKGLAGGGGYTAATNYHRLHARRSAMTNSLVRIGGVEGGELVKRSLAALIRPSSHQQRRRGDFQPRPSRLSVMSMALGLSGVVL